VLIHLRYRFILRGPAEPVSEHFINIAETALAECRTVRIMNDKAIVNIPEAAATDTF
jgi:hypothetical protein